MPLQSIRVLDLTRLLPGPYATMILADFGAEVIKIEDPFLGDYARNFEPKVAGQGAMFHSLNRNKQSISLNLKEDADRKKLLEMIKDADVLIESFRPGVMERLGLDYETLKQYNEGIIYCAITGYGQTGPYKDKPGHDLNYIGYTGLLDLMGRSGEAPIVPATTIADIGGGAQPAIIGILLALFHREKTGEGQFVDISMMDGVISWLQTLLPAYLNAGDKPSRGEQMLDGGRAYYNIYETKDARYLAVGAVEPKFWSAFCEIIERENLIAHQEGPKAKQEEMKAEIQGIIKTKTLAEWTEIFEPIDACVSPVVNFAEMEKNEHVIAREMIQSVKDHKIGKVKHIGIPIKLSKTPGSIRSLAPNRK